VDVLVNAGGKGSRISSLGMEKPLIMVEGRSCIDRVLDVLQASEYIGHILVSVSPNTRKTREWVLERGFEVVDTSGEDFVLDMHSALRMMDGDEVMLCPSDLPLLKRSTVDDFLASYYKEGGESYLAMVKESIVLAAGLRPSYVWELDEGRYVVSGVSVVDRRLTLEGKYLEENFYLNGGLDLAVNVNTPEGLELVRRLISS
jgi:adenosylcobinamide-phosphate guanylyltransferase